MCPKAMPEWQLWSRAARASTGYAARIRLASSTRKEAGRLPRGRPACTMTVPGRSGATLAAPRADQGDEADSEQAQRTGFRGDRAHERVIRVVVVAGL